MTNLSDRPIMPSEPQSDLLSGLFRSWADAWRIGLGVGGMRTGLDKDRHGVPQRPVSHQGSAFAGAVGPGSPAEPEDSAAPFGDGVPSIPEQACWIGFTAWLRYSGAVADSFLRYEASLKQSALDRAHEGREISPSENRVLVDETRAFLRRIGDAASLEARRAQYELEQIGESIARAAAAGDCASLHPNQHVRRHKVKA